MVFIMIFEYIVYLDVISKNDLEFEMQGATSNMRARE